MSANQSRLMLHFIIFCSSLLILTNISAHPLESCSHTFSHKDYSAALKQCTSESKHNPAANFFLGQLYEKGLSVKRNTNKAMSYYRTAVLNNNVDAQIALAQLQTRNKHLLQGHIFFSLAVDNGSLQAFILKDKIASHLSAQDLLLSKGFVAVVKNAIIENKKTVALNY